jgi:hypothetical protein
MLKLVTANENVNAQTLEDLPPPIPAAAETPASDKRIEAMPWLSTMFETKKEAPALVAEDIRPNARPSVSPWAFMRERGEVTLERPSTPAPAAPIERPVARSFNYPSWHDCKPMRSRFGGTCKQSGALIDEGEWILYDYERKQAFSRSSEVFRAYAEFLMSQVRG